MDISTPLMWFFAGVAFLVIELLLPGFVVIFFAGGSFIAAISAWLLNITLTSQTTIFLISSLILLFTLRKYGIRIFRGRVIDNVDDDYVNSRIGKHAVVTKMITPGMPGEIKFMGSFWKASSNDTIKEGGSVVIVNQDSSNGLIFEVRSIGSDCSEAPSSSSNPGNSTPLGNSGSDNSGSDNSGSDNSGSDNSGSSNSGLGNSESGNSGPGNSGSVNLTKQ